MSSKLSYRMMIKMHAQLPQLLYPLFYFQYRLAIFSYSFDYWEAKKKYMIQKRKQVARDVARATEELEKVREAKFIEALGKAVMKDTLTALLRNQEPPPEANAEVIATAKAKVKKIRKQAEKLRVTLDEDAIRKAIEKANED